MSLWLKTPPPSFSAMHQRGHLDNRKSPDLSSSSCFRSLRSYLILVFHFALLYFHASCVKADTVISAILRVRKKESYRKLLKAIMSKKSMWKPLADILANMGLGSYVLERPRTFLLTTSHTKPCLNSLTKSLITYSQNWLYHNRPQIFRRFF